VTLSFGICFYSFGLINFFFLFSTELSPQPVPLDLLADPEAKEALGVINMAASIVDEVVNKLLHEVVEKVLKEE
jgi:hypothetical protein